MQYYVLVLLLTVLMYNVFGLILSKARGEEDEFNTIGAATITGLLYKSSSKCGIQNIDEGWQTEGFNSKSVNWEHWV